MFKRMLAALALSLFGVLALSAAPASADPLESKCYTPSVKGFDTMQVCIFLPSVE
mgnify:CR=1 FL=1